MKNTNFGGLMRTVLVLLLVTGVSSTATAQKGKRPCTGAVPDSLAPTVTPIYRDCDVDKPAKLKGQPRISYQPSTATGMPRQNCMVAEFDFVVDTLGRPEMSTVHARPTNDRDLEDAVSAVLPQLRYEPAQLDNHPVRQVTMYRSTVGVMTRVVSSRGISPPSSPRPPRC